MKPDQRDFREGAESMSLLRNIAMFARGTLLRDMRDNVQACRWAARLDKAPAMMRATRTQSIMGGETWHVPAMLAQIDSLSGTGLTFPTYMFVENLTERVMANSSTYAVVWPRSSKTVDIKPLAPRLASLEGKKIAFLWDYLFRGDEIWPVLSDELNKRYPGMEFVGFEEFGSTHGDEEHRVLAELPDKLKSLNVDAVVSGMGC